MFKAPVIYSDVEKDEKGNPLPIRLTNAEKRQAAFWGRRIYNEFGDGRTGAIKNALGYEQVITTLTTIVKKVSEQKLYEIAPAEYVPIRIGEGTWSSNLETFRSYDTSDVFESGIIDLGDGNSRQSVGEAAIDALNIKVNNWAKMNGWSIFALEMAAKSGNWDLVSAKEKTRKRNWDLGIQRVAFLGARGMNGAGGSCLGLLNQAGITTDTALIPKKLSTMTPAELSSFQANSVEAYRSNCNRTAYPTHFVIPESDYNGLASQSSPDFPIKSKLQLLEEAFQAITRNKGFKILPLAYADVANAGGALNSAFSTCQYTFLNYDEESLRMDIPLDYTNTLANSLDNFNFQNVGYGQFTGVLAYRPAELYYAGF